MITSDIKTHLHQLIDEENDIQKLKQIQAILNGKQGFLTLSEAEKEAIEEGLNQLDEGKGIPHKNVVELFRKEFFYGGRN